MLRIVQRRFFSVKVKSTCPAGTTFKGINVLKDGKDPVAMEDEKYPEWVWNLLEPKKEKWSEEDKLSIDYLRMQSKEKIMKFVLNKRSK
jgi:large subunit ribosomal protein L54